VRGAVLNWETGEIDLRIWDTLQARFNQIKDEIGNKKTSFKLLNKTDFKNTE
jgi:hypothetical protein